jgi:hypothetical protein
VAVITSYKYQREAEGEVIEEEEERKGEGKIRR